MVMLFHDDYIPSYLHSVLFFPCFFLPSLLLSLLRVIPFVSAVHRHLATGLSAGSIASKSGLLELTPPRHEITTYHDWMIMLFVENKNTFVSLDWTSSTLNFLLPSFPLNFFTPLVNDMIVYSYSSNE